MSRSRYWIHGISFEVETDTPWTSRVVDSLLRRFEANFECDPVAWLRVDGGGSGSPGDEPDTRLVPLVDVPLREELVRAGWRLRRAPGRVRLDGVEIGSIEIDTNTRRARVRIGGSWQRETHAIRGYCLFALTELLKLHRLYTIHAAALEQNGNGVLIAGASGHGKTTAALSLMRGGFDCLSDDHPILRHRGSEIEILDFPAGFRIRERTRELIPGLDLADWTGHETVDAIPVSPSGRPGPRSDGALRGRPTCLARVLLLPRIVPEARSTILELARPTALTELLPHGLLVTDPSAARAQFEVLRQLVQSVRCYRLRFGRDVLALPEHVQNILHRA